MMYWQSTVPLPEILGFSETRKASRKPLSSRATYIAKAFCLPQDFDGNSHHLRVLPRQHLLLARYEKVRSFGQELVNRPLAYVD